MYNSEHFILRCLDSILSQKIPSETYEVIIFDDASTDSSKTLVEDYAKIHKNINVYSVQNSGAYVLRNKMLNIAKGKYVYFMDADDCLINKGLDYLLNIAIEKKLDIIGFDTLVEDETLENKPEESALNIEILEVQNGLSYVAKERYMRHEIWWYLIRKDFLNDNQITFEEEPFASDVIFTVETFLKAKRIQHVPIALYKYVQTSNSSTRNKNQKHLLKLIACRVKMIVDFSELINALNIVTEQENQIKQNLNFRRDIYVYMTISDMLKAKIDAKTLKNYISLFSKHNAYPIKDFIGKEFPTVKNKMITYIFNNRSLLQTVLFVLRLKKINASIKY